MTGKVHRNSLKPGHKLHWYRIKAILGQGGFGITYLAHDFNLDEDVAIKEYLPIELAVRERDSSVHPVSEGHSKNYHWGLARFIEEARTLAKFKHPNIVRVRSVFEENNTAYMVMEYEHGQSLQDLLGGRKTLEEAEIIKIMLPILGGLQLVHDAGFIHRDIKPANIFIRKDQSPVLLDFGSARQALGVETRTLTSLISPGYAPFEQYYSSSSEQGPWTDIYGLAATMYRTIVGRAPLDAVDRSKALLNTNRDTFVPVQELAKGRYSERFLKAVDHGLNFRKENRPQSLIDWQREFEIPAQAPLPPSEVVTEEARAQMVRVESPAGTGQGAAAMPEARVDSVPEPAAAKTGGTRKGALVFLVVLMLAGGGWYGWLTSLSQEGATAPVTPDPSSYNLRKPDSRGENMAAAVEPPAVEVAEPEQAAAPPVAEVAQPEKPVAPPVAKPEAESSVTKVAEWLDSLEKREPKYRPYTYSEEEFAKELAADKALAASMAERLADIDRRRDMALEIWEETWRRFDANRRPLKQYHPVPEPIEEPDILPSIAAGVDQSLLSWARQLRDGTRDAIERLKGSE
jgi:serine/threonine protein kinase